MHLATSVQKNLGLTGWSGHGNTNIYTWGANTQSILKLRAQVYNLAHVLTGSFPSQPMLSRIASSPALAVLAEEVEPVSMILEGAEACLHDVATAKATEEDYNNLYIGSQSLTAPLWESVYRDPEHLFFGDATWQVREWYGRYNLAFSNKDKEPDDHITVELEFMHYLISASIEALARPEKTDYARLCADQIAFLQNHLLQWAPQSFSMQLPHAKTALYIGTARLIVDYLPYDLSLLISLQNEVVQ
jgi:TorA maturation chaperone TorD